MSPGDRMFYPLILGLMKVWWSPCIWNIFLSHSCMINLAPSVSKNSPKGNDSELLDQIASWKSSVSLSAHADWLTSVCRSNLGNTLILTKVSKMHTFTSPLLSGILLIFFFYKYERITHTFCKHFVFSHTDENEKKHCHCEQKSCLCYTTLPTY